jgi:hypothetical protein
MGKMNIQTMELVQKKKEEIGKLKKAKFSVTNNQTKLIKNLARKNLLTKFKVANDVQQIRELINSVNPGETLKLISNSFDSPSILKTFLPETLKSIYISTWAITEQGILMLRHFTDKNVKIKVLLDVTHSYKWVFKSGAYSMLNDFVEFKFTENHTKFQLFEFKDGSYITIVGSMNLSNNPRWENMDITRDEKVYNFYKNWMDEVMTGQTSSQPKLF